MANQPKTYISTAPAYVGGVYYKAGESFTTDQSRNDDWELADPVERAAEIAADKLKQEDVNLDALDLPALKALAATKGINLGEAKSKADIITVIKAADEPKL